MSMSYVCHVIKSVINKNNNGVSTLSVPIRTSESVSFLKKECLRD